MSPCTCHAPRAAAVNSGYGGLQQAAQSSSWPSQCFSFDGVFDGKGGWVDGAEVEHGVCLSGWRRRRRGGLCSVGVPDVPAFGAEEEVEDELDPVGLAKTKVSK